jgi:glycosyltransferase involved in cell wall biosynthesis
MRTILLISPYWKEKHRWMVSSFKLAELWQRLGYRVVVVTMGAESGKEVVSPTLTIHRKKDLFLPDPWNYGIAFGFTGLVRRVLREERPDLIVCNKILFWTSLSVIPLALTGHKVILLTDALVGMTWWGRTLAFRLASRVYAWTIGWLIMLASHRFVTFHPEPEGLLRLLGVRRKWRIIPTGIDPTPYVAEKPAPDPAPRACVITYVGRLESVKGVDDFLAAAELVKNEYPEARFRVVGLAPDGHPLRVRYGSVAEFLGLRDDVPEILRSTDVFVMPSHSEGLSNAIMEAMSSGCACIVTDVGGNPFLVQNGVSGFLFAPGDREALAAHLRRLIEDPRKRAMMGSAARKRIEAMFSWEVVGKEYVKLFEEVGRSV